MSCHHKAAPHNRVRFAHEDQIWYFSARAPILPPPRAKPPADPACHPAHGSRHTELNDAARRSSPKPKTIPLPTPSSPPVPPPPRSHLASRPSSHSGTSGHHSTTPGSPTGSTPRPYSWPQPSSSSWSSAATVSPAYWPHTPAAPVPSRPAGGPSPPPYTPNERPPPYTFQLWEEYVPRGRRARG